MRRWYACCVGIAIMAVGLRGDRTNRPSTRAEAVAPTRTAVVRFEENVGQLDSRVRFVAHTRGSTLFLTDDGATLVVGDRAVGMKVRGAREVEPMAGERVSGTTSYFLGEDESRWRANVASYDRVTYRSVLDGVDLVFHSERGELEYDFVVEPGRDPGAIEMEVSGADDVSVSPAGDLVVRSGALELIEPRPRVYVQNGKEARAVAASYRLTNASRVAFELGPYDRSRTLVIDPGVRWTTTFGGSASDQPTRLVVDSAGNSYVAGVTLSADLPVTTGPAYAPSQIGFVAKLDAAGVRQWTTYVGPAAPSIGEPDQLNAFLGPEGLAVDAQGNVYMVESDREVITTDAGAYDVYHVYLAKLGPTGALAFAKRFRGSGNDKATGVATDPFGNIYLTGATESLDFPWTDGSTNGGVFVLKLAPDGSRTWAINLVRGYYAAPASTAGGIAVDKSGNVELPRFFGHLT